MIITLPELFKPKTAPVIPRLPGEVRLPLLQSKALETDNSIKVLQQIIWLVRVYFQSLQITFTAFFWTMAPIILGICLTVALVHADQYGIGALLHAPLLFTLAMINVGVLSIATIVYLELSAMAALPPYFPASLHLKKDGIALGEDEIFLPWHKIQLVQNKQYNFRILRHSNVLEIFVEKDTLKQSLPLLKKLKQLKCAFILRNNLHYFNTKEQKFAENQYESLCLRIPLELLAFEADRQKLFRTLRENLPSDAVKLTADESASQDFDDHTYTAIWLDELRSPQAHSKERILEAGHKLKDDHYQIESVLGYGGFSVVYGARDGEANAVAIKEVVISSGGTRSSKESILKKIVAEIELLKQLDHPGIVKCLDYFTEGGRIYMVLQALDGQNLRDFVTAHGPFAEAQLRDIGKQCCAILEHLHYRDKPLIHRDFTPDNLIWDGKKVSLIDFNVAEEANTTSSPSITGKQAYLAPEQWCGNFTPVGDLYQLGGTLYFLATGQDPEPLCQADPAMHQSSLSDGFCAIVRNLTEADSDKRLATAGEVASKLEATAVT